jgi:hypothetical protein
MPDKEKAERGFLELVLEYWLYLLAAIILGLSICRFVFLSRTRAKARRN